MQFTIFRSTEKVRPPLPRNRAAAWLLSWSLIVPSVCYSILADAPLVAPVALLALLPALFLGRSVPLQTRSLVYAFVLAAVAAVFANLLYKVNTENFFIQIQNLFPFLLTLGICGVYLDQRPGVLAGTLGCALAALMLQGTCLNDPTHIRLPVTNNFLRDRFVVFTLAVAGQSYAVLHLPALALHIRPSSRRERTGLHLYRTMLTALSTILLFGGTVLLVFLLRDNYQRLDRIFNASYRDYLQRVARHKVFGSSTQTNVTLEWKNDLWENEPAIFVQASQAPGYLRGRAYRQYLNGQWTAGSVSETRPLQARGGGYSSSLFRAGTQDLESCVRFDVLFAQKFKPDTLYIPGAFTAVELIADRLQTDGEGAFEPGNWDQEGGYRIFRPPESTEDTWPEPVSPGADHLGLPPLADASFFALSEVVCENAKSPEDRVRKVQRYLQGTCVYDLTAPPAPADVDPILYFLEHSRRGHCELFASAAVLLLRAQGVPCRYVTGFVCYEAVGSGLYMARFSDCHAWAEAWLPEQGWVLVEATPAVGVPTNRDTALLNGLKQNVRSRMLNLFALLKRGYLAEFVYQAAYWLGPWLLGLAALLALFFLIRRLRNTSRHQPLPLRLRATRRLLEERLRRLGLGWAPGQTVRDIIVSLREANPPKVEELCNLLLRYEQLLYGPAVSPTEIDRLQVELDRSSR